jgi:hypothetical protein
MAPWHAYGSSKTPKSGWQLRGAGLSCSGVVAVEGTPYTNPLYRSPENPTVAAGLPAFSYRDVGIVVLDEPVEMDEYAELPEAGLVDTLANKTPLTLWDMESRIRSSSSLTSHPRQVDRPEKSPVRTK